MNPKRSSFASLVLALTIGVVALGLLLVTTTSLPRASAVSAPIPDERAEKAAADDNSPPSAPVKLIFIHHSCGGHWLADTSETDYPAGGLAQELMNNNYFVSATNYGWGPGSIGSNTDIPHWPDWFTGSSSSAVLDALYNEFGQNICGDGMCFGNWTRMADPDSTRENEIIMFKSCFPNSDLYGNPDDPPLDEPNDQYTVENAKAVYNDILTYFATRQDKLFIVITAPPLLEGSTTADRAANARAFNDWLVNDWLDSNGYSHNNVAVFDFYNVLTSNGGDPNTSDAGQETGNHHRWWDGAVQHVHPVSNNYAAYAAGGDDHPTAAGNIKATAEFVPLLNVFYNRWQSGAPPAPTLTLTAPNGGEDWTVGSQHEITWNSTGSIANVSLAYSPDGFGSSHTIVPSTPNDGSYDWTIPDDPSTTVRVRVASVVSPTTVYDDSDTDFTISEAGAETCTFEAVIAPSNATEPVTYVWSPEPSSGQGTASATYQWDSGTHVINVAATNCGGTVNDTYTYTVGAPPACPYPLTGVAISDTPVAAAHPTHHNAPAQTRSVLTSTADTILAGDPDLTTVNVGGLHYIQTYYGDAEQRRSLMRWDLSALPSGVTIEAATVELYRFHTYMENDAEIALYRVTGDWVEGTGNNFYPGAGYSPDGATWTTSDGSTPWTTAGGDYDTTALHQLTIPQGAENNVWVHLNATAAVQAWVGGSASNYGLLLRPLSGEWVDLQFYSHDAVTETLRPRLVITYTSGTPAPALDITSPTAGTRWPVSSTQEIRWNTTGTVAQVNLYYSLGSDWTPIESNVTNSNRYAWSTPPTATTSAQVRVESVISPTTVYDVSAAFTLTETAATSQTVHLPLVLSNYSEQPSCPYPLTGVTITGPTLNSATAQGAAGPAPCISPASSDGQGRKRRPFDLSAHSGAGNPRRNGAASTTPAAQPTGLTATHRSGQTFLTWTEDTTVSGEGYHVYRHTAPIDASNIDQATRLTDKWGPLPEGSSIFYTDRDREPGGSAFAGLQNYVITDLGPELDDTTGLFVWTSQETGDFYYAVTTVESSVEDRISFSTGNSLVSPIAETVADPTPVLVWESSGGNGRVYTQFMDWATFNPTFERPYDHPDGGLQYAYNYFVGLPTAEQCGGAWPDALPIILHIEGHGSRYIEGPDMGNHSSYFCVLEIWGDSPRQAWYYGFSANYDYRDGYEYPSVPDTGPIVNYAEARLLRAIYDTLRDADYAAYNLDEQRIYVYGHSMGGSGALALAMRYPNVFAASFSSEPMTNYRTSGGGEAEIDWTEECQAKWGSIAANLPISNVGRYAGHLAPYNGTGVWDWQNHQANLVSRSGDEMAHISLAHGSRDHVIEWRTQAQPAYSAFYTGRRAFSGVTVDLAHTWTSFVGLGPTVGDTDDGPFHGFSVVRDETLPGLSNASGSSAVPPSGAGATYNMNLEWSASWNDWDGAPVDTAGEWRISLRTSEGADQTVDVTPRRVQTFAITSGSVYTWENRLVSDNSLVASGTATANAAGLVTVPDFAVSSGGNRLRLRPSGATADHTFYAVVIPANATLPITYTWSSDGLLGGQGTASASYQWDTPGVYTVTLEAENCGGETFSDTYAVTVSGSR